VQLRAFWLSSLNVSGEETKKDGKIEFDMPTTTNYFLPAKLDYGGLFSPKINY